MQTDSMNEAQRDTIPSGPPCSGQRSRILVVEDDPAFADLVAWTLTEHGYEVYTSEGAAEARLACEEEPGLPGAFDLVVSDVMVPRGSGTDLLFSESLASRGTPIILMTAFPSPELRAFVEENGGELLEKPFSLEALLERVLDRLRQRFVPSIGAAQ